MKDLAVKEAINERITVETCRLIGPNNDQLGIMPTSQALEIAKEQGLDLIMVAPARENSPAVCRIVDYGRFKFEQTKKQKELKRNQKGGDLKIIQLSLNIGEHDVDYRTKQAREFFANYSKVKVSMMLKGRQQAFASRGIEVCKNFYERISDVCNVEKDAFVEGKYVTMILAPKSEKELRKKESK